MLKESLIGFIAEWFGPINSHIPFWGTLKLFLSVIVPEVFEEEEELEEPAVSPKVRFMLTSEDCDWICVPLTFIGLAHHDDR